MISKWLFTVLAAAVMFITTVELGHFSAHHPPATRIHRDLFAPELGPPTVPEAGGGPAASTSLSR